MRRDGHCLAGLAPDFTNTSVDAARRVLSPIFLRPSSGRHTRVRGTALRPSTQLRASRATSRDAADKEKSAPPARGWLAPSTQVLVNPALPGSLCAKSPFAQSGPRRTIARLEADMNSRHGLLAAVLLVTSIAAVRAQVPTRLVGQDKLAWRGVISGSDRFDSLILTFGTEPDVVSAEFRLTYGRSAAPSTGTMELLITDGPVGPGDGTLPPVPRARKPLTMDEFVALGTSDAIHVDDLDVELILVDSQRGGIQRQADKWTRPR